MAVKEFREFFLRNTQVNTGSKPDQETNFPVSYIVKGKNAFNRFLSNNIPSQLVFGKLFASLTFKLNQEDTATLDIQGLVKKASDTDAEDRLLNPDSDFTKGVVTHQLSEVVVTQDGNDVVQGSPIIGGGLSLSIIRRTLSTKFRKNFLISVATDKSITTNVSTKKLELVGDTTTPGSNMVYSTSSAGDRGWNSISSVQSSRVSQLKNNFSVNDVSPTGSNLIVPLLGAIGAYSFRIVLAYTCLNTAGIKVVFTLSVPGSVTSTLLNYNIIDNTSKLIVTKGTSTDITTQISTGTGASTAGTIEIDGTIVLSGNTNLTVSAAQAANNATASIILAGSTIKTEPSSITT